MVVTIAEHTSDDASKTILKLSTYRLQIFLVNINIYDHHNDMDTKPYMDSLKYMFASVLAILTTCMETGLTTGDKSLFLDISGSQQAWSF